MKQLLDGLVYLHEQKQLCHRDLKGANILLSREGLVQIADFGLARIMFPGNKSYTYTTRVVTLWYRAPELLLGFKNYNFGVDMWSIGCVFAELVTGQVLFQAKTEQEACELLFNICGTPTEETMPGCTQTGKYSVFEIKPRRLREHIMEQLAKNNLVEGACGDVPASQVLTDDWFDLLDNLLMYDHNKRLSASQALQHPFFSGPNAVPPCLPSELPLKELEDQHEFITKAERNKKKDFRKEYTFKHNLDWSGQDQASKGASSLSIISSAGRDDSKKNQVYERSYWKASIGVPASSEVIKPVPERKLSEVKEETDWRVSKNSAEEEKSKSDGRRWDRRDSHEEYPYHRTHHRPDYRRPYDKERDRKPWDQDRKPWGDERRSDDRKTLNDERRSNDYKKAPTSAQKPKDEDPIIKVEPKDDKAGDESGQLETGEITNSEDRSTIKKA